MGKIAPIFAAALYLSLAGQPLTAAPGQQIKRPNIVIILADDWGFTDVGAFGGEIATPNLDSLAAKGVRFSNFHVAGTCSPTRAMLQTGVRSHRAGLGNMPETIPPEHRGKPGYDATLNDRVMTIAQRLKPAGYYTILSGKWHLGTDKKDLPLARGYDRAFAHLQSGADNFEDKPNLLLYDKALWTEGNKPAKLPTRFYSSTLIVDYILRYLEEPERKGRPFLASINFLANHIPVQAEDADLARYAGRYQSGWDAQRRARHQRSEALGLLPPQAKIVRMSTTENWDKLTSEQKRQRAGAMAAHAAMATAMDREIGRLIAFLKARGEFENTIFLFLSDNGPEPSDPMNMGAFTRWNANQYYDQSIERQGRPGSLTAIGAGFASANASPLRGYKFTASEGGLRVPLIVSWPGNADIEPGRIKRGFTHVTDIVPTLLSLTGTDPMSNSVEAATFEPLTGQDLSPMLLGKADKVHPETAALGYELSGNAALFKGDYKLMKNLPPYGDGRWHLYNIATDPGEVYDLAASDPKRVAEMQADYAVYARDDGVLDMPPGYTAPKQMMRNAMAELLVPRLLTLWPWALLIAGIVVVGLTIRRKRRAA
ncbi:MAG: arylsulfatase [Sphingorhabdus sp.]